MVSIQDLVKRALSWISDERDEAEGAVSPSPFKEGFNYDDVLAQLNIVKGEIDRAKLLLMDEVARYSEKLKAAIRSRDNEGIIEAASELAIKKKVLKAVATYSKLIEIAMERIKDSRNLEAIASTLSSLQYAMNSMSQYLSNLAPDVMSRLLTLTELTESVINKAKLLSASIPEPKSLAVLDDEAKKLIAEAAREASEETERIAPKVPATFDPAVLEARLLDYIKANNGVLSISKASEALGVPPEVVRELLARLQAKGVIRLEPLQAQASRA